MPKRRLTRDLAEIQHRVRMGRVHYRREALLDAMKLELSREEIDACIASLTEQDFHKTMPALNPNWSGCWQDVYKPTFNETELYVKLQLFPGETVYVVSFKSRHED